MTTATAPKNIPIPNGPDELAEMVADPGRLAPVIASPEAFTEFVAEYGRRQQGEGTELRAQVEAEVKRGFANWLREQGLDDSGDSVRRLNLSPDQNPTRSAMASAHYNPKAPGAKVDALFPGGTRDFLRATWHGARSSDAMAMQSQIREIHNSFGSTVPADGGFLIPEYLRSELLRVALETALVRPMARVIPMETLTVPFPTIDSTSNASNVYGGVVAYWTEESGQLTDSSAKFGRIKLEAKKLTAYTEVPNELFTDSLISLETFINEVFPEALAWFEDVAFINGTGVGEPEGFLNADAAVEVAAEGEQPANTIVWENIVKMFSRMLPSSIGRAVWCAHIDTFPELATMALSVGTGGSAIWLNNGVEGPPMTILGRPVYFTEKVSSVGTAGDINFVDLGYYLIGDRQTMAADTSPHYRFANDQTAMRFIERVDGRAWMQTAMTPHTGSNTLSPFVKIADRA
ncbi:phage major capsid protein [Streptomyces sp. DSM 42041]|uniref:Phage major capsid protein n=1 Tax=Streptomyces hazeniae TaxID=3075538 RepID=A0ABU2NJR5_9ACTN|nr:phage major capsid protein [Streptomyces sp. DSM 42041]MDT0377235.1 phage major capsid protein [Streptomyces sp. DSM 42041]